MITMLFLLGVLTVICGLIIGIISGSLWGFLTTFVGGIIASVIYFALAKILQNQIYIKDALKNIESHMKEPIERKICSKCQKIHDGDMSSCPYCGHRD